MSTTDKVFNAIVEYKIENCGNSPSVREIMVDAGLSSTSVASYHIEKLEKEGRIYREPDQARHIRIPGESYEVPNHVRN